MAASAKITKILHDTYSDVLLDIVCSKNTFSLQVKEGTKAYQAPPRCAVYALKELFKKESEHLQEQQIIVPTG